MRKLLTTVIVLTFALTLTACVAVPVENANPTTEPSVVTTTTETTLVTTLPTDAATEAVTTTTVWEQTVPVTTTTTAVITTEPPTTTTTKRTQTTVTTTIIKPTATKPTRIITNATTTTVLPPPSYITKDEAIRIALEHAVLKRSEVLRLKAERDVEKKTPVYDVEFDHGRWEYEYEIHAESGKILKHTKEPTEEVLVTKPTVIITTTTTTVPKTTPHVPTLWTTTAPTESYITKEKALQSALDHAKFTLSDVKDVDVDFEIQRGTPVYEIEFEVGQIEYSYTIHAEDGTVVAYFTHDPVHSTGYGSVSATAARPDGITLDVARDNALKHAGLTVDDVQNVHVELDPEDGVYDVDFETAQWEYEYEIDAVRGVVLQHQKEHR